jgi:hypothetical protein
LRRAILVGFLRLHNELWGSATRGSVSIQVL